MIGQESVIVRVDAALTRYRAEGPSGGIAIDLAAALREARDLIADLTGDEK